MHLTQEHTPMPNATAGLRPTGNFLHLCERSKSAPCQKVGQRPLGFLRAQLSCPDPQGTELGVLTNPVSMDHLPSVTASGALIMMTMASAPTVYGSLNT